MAPSIQQTIPSYEKEQTDAFGKRDTGAFEQETLTISKRVFALVDRRGFCDPPGCVRGSIHLQSTRMGWDSGGR